MPGSRRASMVFPDPGGPIINTLCEPAAAISIARLAPSCPATSARSTEASGVRILHCSRAVGNGPPLRSSSTNSASVRGAVRATALTRLASATFSVGSTSVRVPVDATRRATGSAPRTARTLPSSPSSPTTTSSRKLSTGICPVAARMPSAMGRSNAVPSFLTSAGARFVVIRRGGTLKPEFASAAPTRSLLSLTEPAGRPTMNHCGSPKAQSTSTVTSYA